MSETPEGAGKLTIVGTPIGNLGDLSPRAIEALKEANTWLVEDTRVSAKLAFHLGIKATMKVLNDHTHESAVNRYASEIEAGAKMVVLSDGGMPVVSDPGTFIVDECYKRNLTVDAVPGPSAVTDALALSGFFGQRFVFLGFLGRKPSAMRGELDPFADSPLTIVLFESGHRIENLLKSSFEALGERRYAICREMTKAFQQVFRNKLPIIPSEGCVPRKGEFTVVIEGKRRKYTISADE